jgi:hypothetical protein
MYGKKKAPKKMGMGGSVKTRLSYGKGGYVKPKKSSKKDYNQYD